MINIEIIEKHATTLGTPVIVCGNAGYSIQFAFDSEWEGLDPKTARFVYVSNGLTLCEEVEFTGDTVEVPALINTREVMVGVYTDTLCTSTPACIPCELSIRCLAAVPGINGGGTGGGGVTDYNDLTNKPILHFEHAYLDDLTEEGFYLANSYSYGDGSSSWQEAVLIMVNVHPHLGGLTYQYAWTPRGYLFRARNNGVWTEWVQSDYRYQQEPIMPLDGTADDSGVVTYAPMANTKYCVQIASACAFNLPEVGTTQGIYMESSILIYTKVTEAVSFDWGADVLFYDGQVPVIEPGYYDLIFTFDPNAEKWCVGVIRKGAAE